MHETHYLGVPRRHDSCPLALLCDRHCAPAHTRPLHAGVQCLVNALVLLMPPDPPPWPAGLRDEHQLLAPAGDGTQQALYAADQHPHLHLQPHPHVGTPAAKAPSSHPGTSSSRGEACLPLQVLRVHVEAPCRGAACPGAACPLVQPTTLVQHTTLVLRAPWCSILPWCCVRAGAAYYPGAAHPSGVRACRGAMLQAKRCRAVRVHEPHLWGVPCCPQVHGCYADMVHAVPAGCHMHWQHTMPADINLMPCRTLVMSHC